MRRSYEATGAKLASTDERADVRKDMHHAGLLLVRLAGYVSQSPGELVRATVVRAGTPRPCKTALQGATALKALREIVLEHTTARGTGARGAAQGDVDQGSTRRKSSLSSSGVLRQQLGLQNARFQMFHVADGGGRIRRAPRCWARMSSSVGCARLRTTRLPALSFSRCTSCSRKGYR